MGIESVNWLEGVLTFFLTVLMIGLVIKYSSRIGMLDIPNARSSHIAPTPRGAGVGIYLAFLFTFLLFYPRIVGEYWSFFLAQLMVFLVGVYDDNKEASPKIKFIVIIFSAILIFFFNDFRIDTLGTWFGYSIALPLWIALPFTIFAITGFTNALNLIDGLDGLAGGVSMVIFLAFLYIGYHYGDMFIQTVSFFMIAALAGFLIFNWHPAAIFMGDSGSLVLGFTIAAVAIRAIEYVSVTSILFLAALPIIDTIVVMVRRMQRGQSPFMPDKTHLHHKIVMWRKNVDYSVMLLILIQISFSLMGVYVHDRDDGAIFILFVIILLLFFAMLDERVASREEFVLTRWKRMGLLYLKERFSNTTLMWVLGVIVIFLFLLNVLF